MIELQKRKVMPKIGMIAIEKAIKQAEVIELLKRKIELLKLQYKKAKQEELDKKKKQVEELKRSCKYSFENWVFVLLCKKINKVFEDVK